MKQPAENSDHIPLMGVALLVLVCVIWGGNIVSIKVSNQGIPPILAATMRSVFASLLLWAYASVKGEKVWLSGPDLFHGVALGVLFALDFLFLYWGPSFTDASRAVIFLYTTPLWVAVAAHFILPDDRLTGVKIAGLLSAFLGLLTVFGAKSSTAGPLYWVGDIMEIVAALFWASTTIYVKKFVHARPITHFQTLFAQLCFATPVLALGAWIFEGHRSLNLTPAAVAAFGYQTIVVAFFSYLLWFWMIHHYQVSRLSAFTFLSPLFGVLLSGLFLGEALTALLLVGMALVAAGIYLVNRPAS